MGSIGRFLLVPIGVAIVCVSFIKYDEHRYEQLKRNNELREIRLADMSIPPEISDRMRNPSWTIAYWITANELHSDCKKANEFMDENILEKTISRRRGGSYTLNILDYLKSCKNASQRSLELVQPRAKKWCHYKDTDARLDELCTEWEQNGQRYLAQIDLGYQETLGRFQKITNGYYNDKL